MNFRVPLFESTCPHTMFKGDLSNTCLYHGSAQWIDSDSTVNATSNITYLAICGKTSLSKEASSSFMVGLLAFDLLLFNFERLREKFDSG